MLSMSSEQHSAHKFAPGLVGTYQDSEGGDGRHSSSPSSNGNSSWRESPWDDRGRRLPDRALDRRHARPGATSCFVGQPLADNTANYAISALNVIDAKSDPVVVSEIELGSVAMKMGLGNVEIAPVDAALEDGKVVFGGVGVPEIGADIFLCTVVHRAVPGD